MRPSPLVAFALAATLCGASSTLHAQEAPTAPAASAGPPAAAPAASKPARDDTVGRLKKYFLGRPKDQPSRAERLVVAAGASAVSVVGLGVGIGFGIWALNDYLCLRDVGACNKNRSGSNKIEGVNFLTARSEGERKALFADMGYLVAVTFAAVGVLGLAATFWPAGWWPFAGEEVLEPAPAEPVAAAAEPTAQKPTATTTTPTAGATAPAAASTGTPQ